MAALARRFTRFACVVVVAIAATAGAAPAASAAPQEAATDTALLRRLPVATTRARTVGGEVLVAVRQGADARAVAGRLGMGTVRTVAGRSDFLVVEVAPGTEAAAAARLLATGDVVSAAPNPVARIAAVPNDPYFTYQWHLAARSVSPGSANWTPIWGGGITGAGITVAVLDTGVTAHADLDGVVAGWDFIDNDADPRDEHGHGTHVAGTVAETAGNARGVAGVASGASVLPVRVLDGEGVGSYDRILAGLSFAVSNGAKVVNLSFAGDADAGLCKAVADATAAGVVVVAAAGNDGGPVAFPAACPAAIAVSAVNISGQLASYSNRGPQVVLAAPGGDSSNTNGDQYPDSILQYTFADSPPVWGYYFEQGTSMASPHVAGAAALVMQARPGATADQVRSVLTSSATDLGPQGVDPSFGSGLLDISAAVQAAQAAPPAETTTTTQPTTSTSVASATTTTTTPPGTTTSTTAPSTTTSTTTAPSTTTSTTTAPATTTTTSAPPAATVQRVSGENRYATAAAVSSNSWPSGSNDVYLATGASYADALATGGLAGAVPGPLLLAAPCSLPSETAAELQRLHPTRITVVGGPGAVCEAAAAEAGRITGATVVRRAGADRYATAVALSQAGFPQVTPTVYVASGETFADGLSAGAFAAQGGGPLLLTSRCSLPSSTADELSRLSPNRVVVMGGEGAVCSAVVSAVQSRVPGATVERISGPDRYATAVAAAASGWPEGSADLYLAGGGGFADGLAAGVAAAGAGGPLLLVPACGEVPSPVVESISRLKPATITLVGGAAAVCEQVLDRIRQVARG